MKKESLQIQVSLLQKFTEILSGLESYGSQYSADSALNSIDAELNLFKTQVGESSPEYKQMIERKAQVELKIADNKRASEFI